MRGVDHRLGMSFDVKVVALLLAFVELDRRLILGGILVA
jgi:hypothetical protein